MPDIVEELRGWEGDGIFGPHMVLDRKAADEIEKLRFELETAKRRTVSERAIIAEAMLAKAGRDHITLQTNFAAELAKQDAVIEAARDARSEYFTAYPTEGELLKRMQALDAALRKLRE